LPNLRTPANVKFSRLTVNSRICRVLLECPLRSLGIIFGIIFLVGKCRLIHSSFVQFFFDIKFPFFRTICVNKLFSKTISFSQKNIWNYEKIIYSYLKAFHFCSHLHGMAKIQLRLFKCGHEWKMYNILVLLGIFRSGNHYWCLLRREA
jgi:hypothetical protein